MSPKPRSFSRWRCGRVVCSWADGCCATFVFEKRLYLKIDFRTSFSNPDNLRLHLPCSLCSNLRRPFNPSDGCVKVGKIKMRGRLYMWRYRQKNRQEGPLADCVFWFWGWNYSTCEARARWSPLMSVLRLNSLTSGSAMPLTQIFISQSSSSVPAVSIQKRSTER